MKHLRGIVRKALGLLLLAMVFLNVANAAGRYIFRKAIPGSDEILVFSMVWLVFLGACLVSLDGKHLSFDLLPKALNRRWRRVLHRFTCLALALLTGFVALQSWSVLQKLAQVGQKSMATEIPMVIPHGAVLLSFAIICLISLTFAFRPPDSAGGLSSSGSGAPEGADGLSSGGSGAP